MYGGIIFMVIYGLSLQGCTKFKIPVSDGREIIYERGWGDAQATRLDFYYEDPNTTVWLVLNDPNASVHPGKIVIPPYGMIESK